MANSSSPKTSRSSPVSSGNTKSICATFSPPRTWFKWGRYVRLAMAGLLAALAISGCSTVTKVKVAQWKDASSIVSKPVLSQVIAENTTVSLKELNPLAFVTSLPEGRKLVVFDFNSTQLCGFRRCTYAAYEVKGDQSRQVWQEHFNPNLPPAMPLFSVEEDSASGQPCLIVNQVEGNNIRQGKFCYDGRQLKGAENRLLEKSYE